MPLNFLKHEPYGVKSGNMVVVGLGGVTCAGKSTLARALAKHFENEGNTVAVVTQDDFYLADKDLVPLSDMNYWNYDEPAALDFKALENKLIEEISAEQTTSRTKLILVDGNMIYLAPSLLSYFDLCYFSSLTYDECKPIRESRTYYPPEVPGYFDKYVWPAFLEHKAQAEQLAKHDRRFKFFNGLNYEGNFQKAVMDIRKCLQREWLMLSHNGLSVERAAQFVTDASCGAISVFLGTTRDVFEGKQVMSLEYEAYEPMALKELERLVGLLRAQWVELGRIVVHHRLGSVDVCEPSVIIAVSSPHRKEAQLASQFAIDWLKANVPIWKREKYVDGTGLWKENAISCVQ